MAENDVKKRVQDAMKELGISAYAIAKTCSMNERTIYQQTNGSSKLSVEAIQALLRYKPELSASWILLGSGSMLLSEPQHETHKRDIRDNTETLASKTQKERLFAFIKASGFSIRSFEIELGLSNAAISHCNANLSSNVREKVFNRFPQLNKEWLLLGIGKMLNGEINVDTDQPQSNNDIVAALKLTIEKMQKTIDNQEREIAGMNEGISELKGDIAMPHRSVETA